jgi:hypothetical protein
MEDHSWIVQCKNEHRAALIHPRRRAEAAKTATRFLKSCRIAGRKSTDTSMISIA